MLPGGGVLARRHQNLASSDHPFLPSTMWTNNCATNSLSAGEMFASLGQMACGPTESCETVFLHKIRVSQRGPRSRRLVWSWGNFSQEVFMEQPFSCGRQCSVLTDCEKGRQRITLISALTLDDFVDHTRIVLPNARGCSAVK